MCQEAIGVPGPLMLIRAARHRGRVVIWANASRDRAAVEHGEH
jgi:hypothetical protein